jgi:hypothetical protein
LSAILAATSRTAAASTHGQETARATGSSERPTEMKKKPSRRPRNGLISDWITAR